MDTLLSVLLSLNAIVSGGTYPMAQINNYATIYSAQINEIENNLDELNNVLLIYEPEVSTNHNPG